MKGEPPHRGPLPGNGGEGVLFHSFTRSLLHSGNAAYPTHRRALRNMRSHGPSSPQLSGCHEFWTVRNTRSGCGISTVKRPSGVVRPVIPAGEPLGLYG